MFDFFIQIPDDFGPCLKFDPIGSRWSHKSREQKVRSSGELQTWWVDEGTKDGSNPKPKSNLI